MSYSVRTSLCFSIVCFVFVLTIQPLHPYNFSSFQEVLSVYLWDPASRDSFPVSSFLQSTITFLPFGTISFRLFLLKTIAFSFAFFFMGQISWLGVEKFVSLSLLKHTRFSNSILRFSCFVVLFGWIEHQFSPSIAQWLHLTLGLFSFWLCLLVLFEKKRSYFWIFLFVSGLLVANHPIVIAIWGPFLYYVSFHFLRYHFLPTSSFFLGILFFFVGLTPLLFWDFSLFSMEQKAWIAGSFLLIGVLFFLLAGSLFVFLLSRIIPEKKLYWFRFVFVLLSLCFVWIGFVRLPPLNLFQKEEEALSSLGKKAEVPLPRDTVILSSSPFFATIRSYRKHVLGHRPDIILLKVVQHQITLSTPSTHPDEAIIMTRLSQFAGKEIFSFLSYLAQEYTFCVESFFPPTQWLQQFIPVGLFFIWQPEKQLDLNSFLATDPFVAQQQKEFWMNFYDSIGYLSSEYLLQSDLALFIRETHQFHHKVFQMQKLKKASALESRLLLKYHHSLKK